MQDAEPLQRALELTRAIDAATAEGDWARAASIADARSPLLMALAPTQTPEALATIRAIQEIDATIMRRTHDEREAMSSRQSDAMKRIAAASLYQAAGKL